jgi:hypothetical protein
MYFTTNETIGGMFDTRPVAFISIYVEPTTDPNLNQSINQSILFLKTPRMKVVITS